MRRARELTALGSVAQSIIDYELRQPMRFKTWAREFLLARGAWISTSLESFAESMLAYQARDPIHVKAWGSDLLLFPMTGSDAHDYAGQIADTPSRFRDWLRCQYLVSCLCDANGLQAFTAEQLREKDVRTLRRLCSAAYRRAQPDPEMPQLRKFRKEDRYLRRAAVRDQAQLGPDRTAVPDERPIPTLPTTWTKICNHLHCDPKTAKKYCHGAWEKLGSKIIIRLDQLASAAHRELLRPLLKKEENHGSEQKKTGIRPETATPSRPSVIDGGHGRTTSRT